MAICEALEISRNTYYRQSDRQRLQFTSKRYNDMLKILQRTSYKHSKSIGMIKHWHRSLKEEEVWLGEYETLKKYWPLRVVLQQRAFALGIGIQSNAII